MIRRRIADDDLTCAEVFRRMPEKFREWGLQDVFGTFQFHVTGPGGGDWQAVCRGDSCTVERGRAANPDVTMSARDDDVVRLARGRLSPFRAVAAGRVKVRGNKGLLMNLIRRYAGKVRIG